MKIAMKESMFKKFILMLFLCHCMNILGCMHDTPQNSPGSPKTITDKNYEVELYDIKWLNNNSLILTGYIITKASESNSRAFCILDLSSKETSWLSIGAGTGDQADPCGKDNSFIFSYHTMPKGQNPETVKLMPYWGIDLGIYKDDNTWVPFDLPGTNLSADFSPASSLFAYAHSTNFFNKMPGEYDEGEGIYVTRGVGEPQVLVSQPLEYDSDINPVWSPDGNRIVYYRMRSDYTSDAGADLWMVSLNPIEERRLTITNDAGLPLGWNADGNKVYFLREDMNLYSVDVTNGELALVKTIAGLHKVRSQDYIALRPEGKEVALVSFTSDPHDQGLWLIHLDSQEEERIMTTRERSLHRPVWSPDGTQIAVLSNNQQVWIADATGKEPPILIFDLADEASLPTPDTVRTVELANPN